MATTTEKKGFLKKLIGVSGASIAKGVSDTVGGGKLTDYVGSKIAKMRAPADQKKYVEDRTSGKDALKSLGSVALTVAPMGAAVGALRVVRGIAKAASASAKAARAKSAITGPVSNIAKSPMKKLLVKSDPLGGSRGIPGINWGDRPLKMHMKSTREILRKELDRRKLRGTMEGRSGINAPKFATKRDWGEIKTKIDQSRTGAVRKILHENPNAYGPQLKRIPPNKKMGR